MAGMSEQEDEEEWDMRPKLHGSNDRQCCGNCAYFFATGNLSEKGPVVGFCRRYPPSEKGWPEVEERDWCGEWKWWTRP
jgi:hypothetical protein